MGGQDCAGIAAKDAWIGHERARHSVAPDSRPRLPHAKSGAPARPKQGRGIEEDMPKSGRDTCLLCGKRDSDN
jgi:hypothetical protein